MKRVAVVLVGTAIAAAALAAWSVAAPSRKDGAAAPAAKQALPPLPAAVKARKRWIIGVKCDVPPFGYIDVRGKNAGFDVEVDRAGVRGIDREPGDVERALAEVAQAGGRVV